MWLDCASFIGLLQFKYFGKIVPGGHERNMYLLLMCRSTSTGVDITDFFDGLANTRAKFSCFFISCAIQGAYEKSKYCRVVSWQITDRTLLWARIFHQLVECQNRTFCNKNQKWADTIWTHWKSLTELLSMLTVCGAFGFGPRLWACCYELAQVRWVWCGSSCGWVLRDFGHYTNWRVLQ